MNAHWNQNERNMKGCRSAWNKQNNSSIHFRASLRMDFGFMLDLEYADFHKTLESDRAPQSDTHNNSNYSDVKDFDGNSYIQHGCSVQLGSDTILDTLYHFSLVAIWQFFLSTFPLHFEFTQVQKPCSTWVLDNSRRVGMAGHSAGPRCRDRGIWPANTLWVYFGIWVWVNTYRYIFSGMNIHLPAILGFTRYQGFDPSPYHYFYPKHSSSEPF